MGARQARLPRFRWHHHQELTCAWCTASDVLNRMLERVQVLLHAQLDHVRVEQRVLVFFCGKGQRSSRAPENGLASPQVASRSQQQQFQGKPLTVSCHAGKRPSGGDRGGADGRWAANARRTDAGSRSCKGQGPWTGNGRQHAAKGHLVRVEWSSGAQESRGRDATRLGQLCTAAPRARKRHDPHDTATDQGFRAAASIRPAAMSSAERPGDEREAPSAGAAAPRTAGRARKRPRSPEPAPARGGSRPAGEAFGAGDTSGSAVAERDAWQELLDRHPGQDEAIELLAAAFGDGSVSPGPVLVHGCRDQDKVGLVLDVLGYCAESRTRWGTSPGMDLPAVGRVCCDHVDGSRGLWQALAFDLARNEAAKLARQAGSGAGGEEAGTHSSSVRPAAAGVGIGVAASLHATCEAPDGGYATSIVFRSSRAEQLLRRRACADLLRSRAVSAATPAELARSLREVAPTSACTFLVVSSAERLRVLEAGGASALLRMPELARRAICPIFVTDCAPAVLDALEPSDRRLLLVRAAAPAQAAVVDHVARRRPEGAAPTVYRAFSRHVVSLFAGVCGRSTDEAQFCARTLWPIFEAKLLGEGANPLDDALPAGTIMAACRAIQPDAMRLRGRLFHHDVQAASATHLEAPRTGHTAPQRQHLEATGPAGLKLELPSRGVELPYLTKFALVGAYVASTNPPDTDARFFSKGHSDKPRRQRRARKSKAVRAKEAQQRLLGPRAFVLDRLLCIVHSVLALSDSSAASDSMSTSGLQAEVATLVSLNLLERVSAAGELDAPKFRCIAGQATVDAAAQSAGVDLAQFVYDPERHA